MKFNSIRLLVRDVEVSVAFYGDIIGMDVNYEEPHFAIVGVEEFRIMFHTDPDAARKPRSADAEYETRRKCAGATMQFEVDDVDAFYQGLVDQGLLPATQPTDQAWGWRDFAVTDPDGYRLVFWAPQKVEEEEEE